MKRNELARQIFGPSIISYESGLTMVCVCFLSALVTSCASRCDEAPVRVTRSNIEILNHCITIHKEEHGRLPLEEEGLKPLTQYFPESDYPFTDAWDTPLRYRIIGGSPAVESAGPDQMFDTSDDIR